MKKSFTIACFIILQVRFSCNADARIIHVPTDQASIQDGIDASTEGDTVLVAEGTYFENINFNGKAITLASMFLMDGDTAHVSRTIIDGSQAENPNAASVVLMKSGESSSSVLCGFTLTAGGGTMIKSPYIGDLLQAGGGVCMYHSGGTIRDNIIENNIINASGSAWPVGNGIWAFVSNNKTAFIRNNLVRNNHSSGDLGAVAGCGMAISGGGLIIENNFITGNSGKSKNGMAYGGGITYLSYSADKIKSLVVIRNNTISNNKVYSDTKHWSIVAVGGGLYLKGSYDTPEIEIYNNLIYENYSEGAGGGLAFQDVTATLFNNTITNNVAERYGNSIYLITDSELALINNILWSNSASENSEIDYYSSFRNRVYAKYNNIRNGWTESATNLELEPRFAGSSFELNETSSCVGRGADSVMMNNTWYIAPKYDLNGNARPDDIDTFVDIGAFESGFARSVHANADLKHIRLWDRKLHPSFHKDSLNYVIPVPDTITMTPRIMAYSSDWLADINISHASDVKSLDPLKRHTNILVTANDGTTHKEYNVSFRIASKDSLLSNLSVSEGKLYPSFHPDSFYYKVYLEPGSTESPTTTCITSDPNASYTWFDAYDITSHLSYIRTTFITVRSEDGLVETEYTIEFILNPEVNVNESISSGIIVFPNPFKTNLTITMNSDILLKKVEILSLDGRVVRIVDQAHSSSITINRQGLPTGLYFFRIYADKTYIRRVIIE